MKPKLLLVLSGLMAMAMCGTSNAESDVIESVERISELVKKPAPDRDETKEGRYTLRSTEKGTILLDTVTGQTWMLTPYQDKQAWLPVPRVDSIDKLRELGASVSVKNGLVR